MPQDVLRLFNFFDLGEFTDSPNSQMFLAIAAVLDSTRYYLSSTPAK